MALKEMHANSKEAQAYNLLVKACLSISPEQDLTKLDCSKASVLQLSQEFHEQVEAFKTKISNMPLSAFILLWAEQMRQYPVFGSRYLMMMNELIEMGFLTYKNLQGLSEQNSTLIIDKIRCYKEWSIGKREDYVLLYRTFSEWLSKQTCSYISEAKDVDRLTAHKRLIPFEKYIELLSYMDLRERILTKIFYLGGPRNQEEVLSVKIEDVDFNNCTIHFSEPISYPRHLFEDIKAYIEDRERGFVFLGRDGEKIAYTTPFRALKAVVSGLKLDPQFTFKDLTRNI